MAPLKLNFAAATYDRMLALRTGDVKPDGIDLNFIPIEHVREIFDRMGTTAEFDLAEAREVVSRMESFLVEVANILGGASA